MYFHHSAGSANEPDYVLLLETAGYVLTVRECNWHEHCLLRGFQPDANVHVFSPGYIEIDRMLGFRDWLRAHPDDRRLYETTKRTLAARQWVFVQDYADAKTTVVEDIQRRAGLPASLEP